jgi:hypothetical protein
MPRNEVPAWSHSCTGDFYWALFEMKLTCFRVMQSLALNNYYLYSTEKIKEVNTMNIKRAAYFFLAIILLVYAFSFLRAKNRKRNFTVATGEIKTVFTSSKNSTVLVRYAFKLNGKEFTGVSSTGCPDEPSYYNFLNHNLTSKSLTVVYKKDNPTNSEMLFSSRDYKNYKLPITDQQEFVVHLIDSLLKKE